MKKIIMFVLSAFMLAVNIFTFGNVAYADEVAESESASGADSTGDNSFSDSLAPAGAMFLCNATGYNASWKKNEPDKCLYLFGGTMENVCAYKEPAKPNQYEERYTFITTLTASSQWVKTYWTGWIDSNDRSKWKRNSQRDGGDSDFEDATSIVLNCYLFSSEEKARAYLRGEIDASEADNFGDVTPEDIDKNIPYYDKFSVNFDSSSNNLKYQLWEFNGDITGKTSVSMSENQQVKLQECKNVYYRYVDYAVYIEQAKGASKTPDQESNGIKTDSQKRLIVGSISSSSTWGLKAAENFSVIGESGTEASALRLVESKTMDNSSFLNASETLDISFSNKHVIDRNAVLGTRYKLIGHVVAIQCYTYENGQYKYGQTTFGYGWRKGYGKNIGGGGYVVDPDSPDPPTPVDPTDPTPTDPVNPTSPDFLTYIKQLYANVTSYVTLTKNVFSFLPGEIWTLIMAGLGVTLALCVFKIIRG